MTLDARDALEGWPPWSRGWWLEDVVVVDWGNPTKPPSFEVISACNEGS
jgi:hypothetical protein